MFSGAKHQNDRKNAQSGLPGLPGPPNPKLFRGRQKTASASTLTGSSLTLLLHMRPAVGHGKSPNGWQHLKPTPFHMMPCQTLCQTQVAGPDLKGGFGGLARGDLRPMYRQIRGVCVCVCQTKAPNKKIIPNPTLPKAQHPSHLRVIVCCTY